MKKLILFFILFTASLNAQDKIKVNLNNPNSTVLTHWYFLQQDSYEPTKAAATIYGYEGEEAVEIALKLKQIFEGKGLKIDFNKIPADSVYTDSTRILDKHRFVLFPLQLPTIYVEKIGSNWYFSPETTNQINEIWADVFPWYTEKLLQMIPDVGHKSVFNIEIWKYLGFALLLICCALLFYVLQRLVYFLLRKVQYWIVHYKNDLLNIALKKLARPVVFLILMGFVKVVLPSLFLPLDVNNILFLAINIMQTVFWIYVFLKLVKVVMNIYSIYAESTESKLDDQLIPVLNNFLSGLVVFIGFLKLLTILGVDPVTVVAGASIGGLAVALASQDTVKNLIGTVMIFLDKPFHIGDWIEAGTVMGTVEKVGFRSTRVRAADTSIFQIPNSALAEMVVNNKGLRAYRRYTTNLGIRYDTPPDLIEAFVVGVRKVIELDPGTRDDAFNVEFIGFGDSSLLILLNVYFHNLDWNTEQASKHKLHMAILKLAAVMGVEFAFPSTTVMIEQFPEKKNAAVQYNVDDKRIKQIIDDINKPS
ncbi:mechanosensitive ion channel family protein [Lutibacter sp. HS1-25]|uniref:mechanosensitive ion channel family protein n=1 Tax=Lutibacter sp. HS1-25 TaxID=2485000 RepID=UPI0010137FA8|nr:mechanosensitive ion channel family protein [Lutibacter sp. HS1-25]RXP56137.1 mechanosensitive ion channel family protein [Lutibacter sp. HS1-25]